MTWNGNEVAKPLRRVLSAVAAFLVPILLVGCSSSVTTTSTSGTERKTAVSPTTTTTALPRPPTTTTTTMATGPTLTTYGATLAQWASHHTHDNIFATNAAWNPDPNLPQLNGHIGADYTIVSVDGGRILSYQLNFVSHTSIGEARSLAAAELPADATSVWYAVQGTCAQEEFSSSTLATALGGGSNGQVFVEYETYDNQGNQSYSGSDITDAFFQVGSSPTQANAPGC